MQIYKNNYINKRDKIHKIKIKFFFLYFKDYVDYYYFFFIYCSNVRFNNINIFYFIIYLNIFYYKFTVNTFN